MPRTTPPHPALAAGVLLLALSHADAADAPPSPALSPELLKALKAKLEAARPISVRMKVARAEMAARIIQADLALAGKGGSGFEKATRIDPADARAVLSALGRLKPGAALGDARTRGLIWAALACAHPCYRLYVEGVRLAGHIDDPDVLAHALGHLKAHWLKAGRGHFKREGRAPLEPWMLGILTEALRFQGVAGVEDAAALLAEAEVVPESMTGRPRSAEDPPALLTSSLLRLRAENRLAAYDRAVNVAAALQRAGHEATLWSIALARKVDGNTKTVAQESVIVYPERDGKGAVIALAADDVLAHLGGEKLGLGAYRFTSAKKLNELLEMRGQFKAAMKGVLEATNDPAAWAAALQKGLEARRRDAGFADALLELSLADPMEAFHAAAAASLDVEAKAAFARFMREREPALFIARVEGDKLAETVRVRDFDARGKAETLPAHEAAFGRALHVLPMKVPPLVRSITLQSRPAVEKRKFGEVESGRVTIKEELRPLNGMAWNSRLMMARPSYQDAVHELMHVWDYTTTRRFDLDGWSGAAPDLFHAISWIKGEKDWELRTGEARIEDFLWAYGAVSRHEDLAVTSQYFSLLPRYFRAHCRTQMARGNYTPAVKYLFMRHVGFQDVDGLGMEFEVDKGDPSLTVAEVRKEIQAAAEKTGGKLTAGARHAETMLDRITALSAAMRKE